MNQDRNITLRRNLEQIKHCVEEALSVVQNDEDPRSAVDDLEQAQTLIVDILPKLKETIPTTQGAMRRR